MRRLRTSRLLFGRQRRDVAALEQVAAGGRAIEQAEQVQQRGLARARRAHHRDVFAGLDAQVELVQRVHFAVAEPEHAFDTSRSISAPLPRSCSAHDMTHRALTLLRGLRPFRFDVAPAFTPARSSDVTTLSPAASPSTTSVYSQFESPVFSLRSSTSRPSPTSSSTRPPSSSAAVGTRSTSGARRQHHLDVGAVAHQQPADLRRVVERRLDVDRARLFLDRCYVRRDTPDLAGKRLSRQRVERDAHRAGRSRDLRRIDLVHRRLHVQARLVDQVDRRRRRHAWRRGRRVLAHLADDLGDRAVERRNQHRASLLRVREPDVRLGLRDVGASPLRSRRPSRRPRRARFRSRWLR